jgi:hypothetical protein
MLMMVKSMPSTVVASSSTVMMRVGRSVTSDTLRSSSFRKKRKRS